MAAELEYRDGVANVFYANQTPWHKEGVRLTGDEVYDFDGLMARHFDYPLEKLPFYRPVDPAADGARTFTPDPTAAYIWRPDTGKVLGAVGEQYELVPNRDAFEVLKPLVDQRVAAVETGGVLRDGADAWLLLRFAVEQFGPDARAVFAQDGGLLPYATVMANHSGRRGVLVGNTCIRVCCSNTLGMAETAAARDARRWRSVPHKHDAKSKLVEAAQDLFAGVVARFEVIARQYRLLMGTRLDAEWFERLVQDVVAPDPRTDPRFNPEAKLAGVVAERVLKKRAEVRRLWFEGKGHTGEPTAWLALNAACELLDHNRELYPTRAGSWRTASLLDGELARLKNAVLDGLVAHAEGPAA